MKRIMIVGTNSGCGKTTVTCGLLQALSDRGLSVSSFKCGPDYIDPMFHSRVIGTASYNLDPFFLLGNDLKRNLDMYGRNSDIAVIEGVMGYYDGVGEKYSSYSVASVTDTPVILVINAKGMSLSMGAVINGFLTYRPRNNIVGVIFNRLPESMIKTAKDICIELGIKYLGRVPENKDIAIESRHLGLVTADEIVDLKEKMTILSAEIEANVDVDSILELASEKLEYVENKIPDIKPYVRIAVSKDPAFCFIYKENTELLQRLGAEIVYFSPLEDEHIPENIDGLILVGGYPELYAEKLFSNHSMMNDIKKHIENNMPCIAECGGFMYLHDRLVIDDKLYIGVGVIDGEISRKNRLVRFGYSELTAMKDNVLCSKGDIIPVHEFHYFDSTSNGNSFVSRKISNGNETECIHTENRLFAGFPHLYFHAAPDMAYSFLHYCEEYKNEKN